MGESRFPSGTRVATITALLALASGWLAWRLEAGVAATPDSTNYLNAALHLAAGDGYVTGSVALTPDAAPQPLTLFPPGLSALLAMAIGAGLEPRAALGLIACAAFVAWVLGSASLLRSALPRTHAFLAAPCALALAIQPGLRESLGLALSDLPGAALTVWATAVALRDERPSLRRAAFVGLLLGCSILVRWANLYVAATLAGLWFVLAPGAVTVRERLRAPLAMVLPVALLVTPCWLRNLWLGDSLMGERPALAGDPVAQLGDALLGVSGWLTEARASLAHHPSLLALHGALAFAVGFVVMHATFTTRDLRARMCAGLLVGYALSMALSTSLVQVDPISDGRFWLLVPPIAVALVVRLFAAWPHGGPSLRLAVAAWSVLALHATVVSGTRVAEQLAGPARFRGYFEPHLDRSRALAQAVLRADRGECALATNDPYFLLPRVGTRPLRFVGYDELEPLARYPGALCIVTLRDPRLPWTLEGERADVRKSVRALVAEGQATLLASDDVAELYVSQPRALASHGSPCLSGSYSSHAATCGARHAGRQEAP